MFDFFGDMKFLGGVAAALSVAVAWFVSMWKAEKRGQQKVINKQRELDLINLNSDIKERERIREINIETDLAFDDLTLDDLDLLRAEGYTSVEEIASAVNRGVLRRIKEGLQSEEREAGKEVS